MRRELLTILVAIGLVGFVPVSVFAAPTPTAKPNVGKSSAKQEAAPKSTKATAKKKPTPKPTKKTPTKKTSVKVAPKPASTEATSKAPDLDALSKIQGANSKEPTFINSDSLTLNADDRVFVYSGNVEVRQGLMTLTCAEIVGRYNDRNQIDTIDARKDVVIVKEDIQGTAQKAFFDAKTNTVTLTENPEVHQNGSILSADSITIFLNENRSVAEGTVRVKLVEKSGSVEQIKLR